MTGVIDVVVLTIIVLWWSGRLSDRTKTLLAAALWSGAMVFALTVRS